MFKMIPGFSMKRRRNWNANGHLCLLLSLLLLARTNRVLAEEDHIDYRHEWYREDDNRMNVDTDSVLADVTVNKFLKLSGKYVEDAISGATPTGAPPQSQWPYPKFADFYQTAYNQLLQLNAGDPGNLSLLTGGYFATPQDYTNYIASTYNIAGQATNSAAGSYNSLTNNPNFRNTKVPVTHLRDHRRAFSLNAPITFGVQTFTPEVSVSKESDYHSYGLALNYAIQLNQKNTTLSGGWSFNNDRVRDDTEMNWQKKISHDFFVGVNQILTPKSYISFDLTYGTEHGYLSDPYRGVIFLENFLQTNPDDASLTPEVRPRHRDKVTFYTSYTQFITPLNGSLDLGYRFFHDTSEIFAQTAEVAWHQKFGRNWVLTPSFRYYYQTAANYYYVIVPDFNTKPEFYSSDYRLSELQSCTLGLSLTYRLAKHWSADLSYTRYVMEGLDGQTSQSAYPAANIFSAGFRLWF